MLNRFLLTLVFLVCGLNFIYLGCKFNGSDIKQNPVWEFLDGFVTFEKYTLITLIVGASFMSALYLVSSFLSQQEEQRQAHEREQRDRLRREREQEERWQRVERKRQEEAWGRVSFAREAELARQKQLKETSQTTATHTKEEPKLSPRELKEKAIQDILRR